MTREEEYRLVKLAQAGDREAAGALLEQHRWALLGMAKNSKARGMDFDDRLQTARLMFLESLQKFDPQCGIRLSTFTYRYVLMRLRSVALYSGVIHLRYYARKHFPELADRAMHVGQLKETSPAVARESSLLREHEFPDLDGDLRWRAVQAAMQEIPERNRQIIQARLEGKTLLQIGAMLGISKERVRQLEGDALGMIRRRATKALTAAGSVV